MINKWHDWINMKWHDKEWHENDLAEELTEYYEETKIIKKWSELSDVVYTYTRGRWGGYDIQFPFKKWQFYLGLVYMFPKYTDRWLFFRAAGRKAGAKNDLHAVRNPRKTHKLHKVAENNGVDKEKFQRICENQLKYWPLLP
jgi:hypothetical protein